MQNDVVVTGYGVLTAFGFGDGALRDNVFKGIHGFRPVTRFDASGYRAQHAAEGDVAPRQVDALRSCARDALTAAALRPGQRGVAVVGTMGDFAGVSAFWRAHVRGEPPPAEDVLAETAPATLAGALADAAGLRGRRLAFNGACTASSAGIAYACELITKRREDLVICAGSYLVEEEFFAKFDSGRAFSRDGRLRAFARGRSGLLLGDGAAVIVLEREERARTRGARVLARIAGWGVASDAYHVCRPHPDGDGLARAIRKALKRGGVEPRRVGYVNAHGTGTRINDVAETRGLKLALGGAAELVPVSSTKTTTGHTLEAAGVVETVVSIVALSDGLVPPTAGYTDADAECDLDYVPNEPRPAALEYVLNVNCAFGGVNTAILVARP